ncbi:hypothetical protein [Leisingera sp.]|uniref:hypothetical protein n=1 Tax=Leisingera sp. TaxID=1879318 RepID=UPI002B26E32E|nr:hypothetical protein [Leisingera sp.]
MKQLNLFTLLLAVMVLPGVTLKEQEPPPRLVWNPPARYDHEYAGALTIVRVPQKQVVTLCRQLFKGNRSDLVVTNTQKGCAWRYEGECTVITIDRVYQNIQPKDVIRHETGHCNGWPSDHPD